MDQQPPQTEYKPNIYPIMYWGILYGVIAALALLTIRLLADFISVLWFPVFLAGLIWGGYRKYVQDKAAWMQSTGTPSTTQSGTSKSPVEEFKAAARDIAQAGREMIARQAVEDAVTDQAEQIEQTETPIAETIQKEAPQQEEQTPPQSPLQPLV